MYDWLHVFGGEWEGWALVTRSNHTSRVTAVAPTDRRKSVRNCCEVKGFGGVFYVVPLFGFFCECEGVCRRTESDLFLFLSSGMLRILIKAQTVSMLSYVLLANSHIL